MIRTLLATATLALLPAAPYAGSESGPVRWDALATDFLTARGLEGETPATAVPETLLASEHYCGTTFALFDVRFPATALEDTDTAKMIHESLLTILDLEQAWLTWTEPDASSKESLAHHKELRKWLKALKPRTLMKLPAGADLLEGLGAKEKVTAALDHRQALSGIRGEAPRNEITQLILVPDRRGLLEHNAYAGWLDADRRPVVWTDSMVGVNSAWIRRIQVVALEGAEWPVDLNRPLASQSLDKYEKNGRAQHVAERAAHSLTRTIYYHYGIHFFESALADNLVIAACGRNTTGEFQFDNRWSKSGGRTEAYERFVPGGNSAGGVLPARKAYGGPIISETTGISKYRTDGGVNHFIEPLQEAQKEGAKLAKADKQHPLRKNKRAHFELHGDGGKGSTFVTAPFYGPGAEGKKLPGNEFLDDYEDFFRAYRVCFFHWLRTGGGKKVDPVRSEQYARLIVAQAEREEGVKLADQIEEIFGLPMSSTDPEEDSLEWQFLAWLAKQ